MVVLETARLRFRQLTWDDLDRLYEFYSNPEIMQYFPGQVRSYETTQNLLRGILSDYTSYGYGLWGAILKSNEHLIGRCGLIPYKEGTEGEIAWLFAKAYWGQGLGTESAIALVRHGFDVLGLSRIFAKADPTNHTSINIMKKIGMLCEGLNENQRMVYSLMRRAGS